MLLAVRAEVVSPPTRLRSTLRTARCKRGWRRAGVFSAVEAARAFARDRGEQVADDATQAVDFDAIVR